MQSKVCMQPRWRGVGEKARGGTGVVLEVTVVVVHIHINSLMWLQEGRQTEGRTDRRMRDLIRIFYWVLVNNSRLCDHIVMVFFVSANVTGGWHPGTCRFALARDSFAVVRGASVSCCFDFSRRRWCCFCVLGVLLFIASCVLRS